VRDERIGVAVLTHDRRDDVLRTVGRTLALPERPRVVVVDNASTDGTARVLRDRFPGLEVLSLARNEGAAARNVGVMRLPTPYVALSDDDTWWAPGSLARAADLLDAHPALAAVTARVLVGPEERDDPACLETATSPLLRPAGLPGPAVLGLLAGACVVRREAFLDAGGFEPRFFLGGEEQLLAADLAARGFTLAYVRELVVHHHPSPHRDPVARRRLVARNRLWFAWLRRPLGPALLATARAAGAAALSFDAAWALVAALGGLPWIARERRVLPASVEARVRRLEAAHRGGAVAAATAPGAWDGPRRAATGGRPRA
jgi:GT2 family glycosyltransferase